MRWLHACKQDGSLVRNVYFGELINLVVSVVAACIANNVMCVWILMPNNAVTIRIDPVVFVFSKLCA